MYGLSRKNRERARTTNDVAGEAANKTSITLVGGASEKLLVKIILHENSARCSTRRALASFTTCSNLPTCQGSEGNRGSLQNSITTSPASHHSCPIDVKHLSCPDAYPKVSTISQPSRGHQLLRTPPLSPSREPPITANSKVRILHWVLS